MFLASRYLYSRFTSPAHYGVSGGLRWALFGAMLALLCFLASYVLPLPDRDGDLAPYALLRLLDFVVVVLAMLVSYRVAFQGVAVLPAATPLTCPLGQTPRVRPSGRRNATR